MRLNEKLPFDYSDDDALKGDFLEICRNIPFVVSNFADFVSSSLISI